MPKGFKEFEEYDKICDEVEFEHEKEGITEAMYQGKKVKLNDPIRGGSKKFYVYVKDGDKVKKVSFGDTTGLSLLILNPVVSPNDTFLILSPSLTYT